MFLRDCLSKNMSYRDIQKKYNINNVWEKFQEERAKYTSDEINNIMNEVYYEW